MMYRQDIKNEVVGYIRNSGERVEDYNVDVIVDSLVALYERGGVDSYRDWFEAEVFENRIAEWL